MRGARHEGVHGSIMDEEISIHAPLMGRDHSSVSTSSSQDISISAPLKGRDEPAPGAVEGLHPIAIHAPLTEHHRSEPQIPSHTLQNKNNYSTLKEQNPR